MALIKKLQTVYHQDKDIQDIQKNIKESFDSLQRVPFLDGNWIKNLSVSTTAIDVPHLLNRAWRGYIITYRDNNISVWTPAQTDRNKYITIDASTTAIIDIWVF